ncbi:glycosyltransferase [Patescibacteria group bacterium]|nr:glycosyltransferase [Patescibacteria group bacterium]
MGQEKVIVSIIIPTLNEEEYLPNLLGDLKKQKFEDYEVIVADAGSNDRTKQIAKEFGAKVIKGGLPSMGRNAGAKAAMGEFLFFFDADIRLPVDFLQNAFDEIQERFLDLATCDFWPETDLIVDKVLHKVVSTYFKVNQYTDPQAPGFCLLVSKRLFDRVGGFDEEIKLAEDHDFARRASELRPLRFLYSTHVWVSVRRLQKEGRLGLVRKYLSVRAYRLLIGELKGDVMEYEFDKFDEGKKFFLEDKMLAIDRRLNKINERLNEAVKGYVNRRVDSIGMGKYVERIRDRYRRTVRSLIKLMD